MNNEEVENILVSLADFFDVPDDILNKIDNYIESLERGCDVCRLGVFGWDRNSLIDMIKECEEAGEFKVEDYDQFINCVQDDVMLTNAVYELIQQELLNIYRGCDYQELLMESRALRAEAQWKDDDA